MNLRKQLGLLAFAGMALAGSTALAQTPLAYTDGDVFLGFRVTSGADNMGLTSDYLVNIGAFSAYENATGPITVSGLGSMKTDLDATFGSSWSSRPNVHWSVSGKVDSTTTLYASKPQVIPGTVNSTGWARASAFSQAQAVNKIGSMASAYQFTGATNNNSTANNPKGIVQSTSTTNAYARFQPSGIGAGNPAASYSYFSPTAEGNFANGTAGSVLELYKMTPGSGDGTLLGLFTIDDAGAVTFAPASRTGNPNVNSGGSTAQFQVAAYTLSEAATSVAVTIIRGGNLSTAVDVQLDTVDGTAVAGTDFTAIVAQNVHFNANELQKTVTVTLPGTLAGFQPDRSFTVALSNPTPVGTTLSAAAAINIQDTTSAPIGFTAATFAKAPKTSAGALISDFVVAVTRSNGRGAVSATVTASNTFTATVGTTRLTTPTHYTFTPSSVSFADGETSKNVTVSLVNAATAPSPAQFRLILTTPIGTTFGIDTTTVTITKKDATKPVIVITTPTVAANGQFTLAGTVKDDNIADLTSFTVSLNGSTLLSGVTRDAYAQNVVKAFSAGTRQAINGANLISVSATDAEGNAMTVTKSFTYNNAILGAALVGTYNGVLLPSGTPDNDKSGYVTITVTAPAGAFTGKITLGGITVPFSGLLNNAGGAHFKPVLTVTSFDLIDKVEFDSYLGALSFAFPPGGGSATGMVMTASTGGSQLATFTADKQATAAPVGLLNLTTKGLYNVALPSEEQTIPLAHTLYPQGDCVASLTLATNGTATLKGNLADGTAFAAAGRLATDNVTVHLHVNLYKKQGSIAGKLTFDLLATDTDVSGANFLWVRPALPRARYYKAGWPNGLTVDAAGTRYDGVADVNFGQGIDDLTLGNSTLVFEDGALTGTVSKGVNIVETTGVVKLIPVTPVPTDYKLTLSASTGLFSGFFTHQDTTKPAFKGVLLNKGANKAGFGYFLSTPPATYSGSAQGGGVSLQP